MAHKIGDRIKEQASTSGTGAFTLAGALAGFEAFSSVLTADSDTTWYCAVNNTTEWELGLGTRTSSTVLDRTTVLSSSNAGAVVDFTAPPVVFCTVPAEALTHVEYTDPAGQYFGPTGIVVEQTAGKISGDPFVVWDGSQFVMYFFRTVGTPAVQVYYKTAASLEGPWSAATAITALSSYHKFVVLVDEEGIPVNVGGTYHGYAVYFNGTSTDKEIFHFTATSLTGAWTIGSKVIGRGASGSKDEYNADTPYAIYKNGQVLLWYMAAPSSALDAYGLAERMLCATAAAPDGPFTKDYSDVLLPSTSAAWDYGWLGGVQIRKRPAGGYVMVYNAGNTRPTTAGTEPDASAIGMAYATNLSGPWTKDPANPYLEITGTPSDALEKTNVWRGHLAWDSAIKRWYLFYNTGTTETITFARQGAYDYFYTSGGNPYVVQALTTSKVAVANSRVNLLPGVYRVRVALNVIGDSGSTSLPKLDVDTSLRVNGTDYKTAARDFIGSYAYENRDLVVEHIVPMAARGYIDAAVQVTGGTPGAGSQARRLRVTVQRLGR